jgi:hypothetical protein
MAHRLTTAEPRKAACWLAAVLLGLTGCTPQHYRLDADRETYAILATKAKAAEGQVPPFAVEGPPASRNFDPTPPDHPPMPPDDPGGACLHALR